MKSSQPVRWLIWLFFWLLIFEGALRKWVLPGFSDYLLLVRDPVLLAIYAIAFARGIFPWNGYTLATGVLGILAFAATLVAGHGNLVVAVFGFRTNFLFVPLIFLIPRVFDRGEVLRMGRVLLWLAIPMTALLVLQFFQPQSAWVNRAPGGIEGGGFDGALERFRPPGTFSFISGPALFYPLAGAFWILESLQKRRGQTLFLMTTAVAILLAVPLSISRILALSLAIVFGVGVLSYWFAGVRANLALRFAVASGAAFAVTPLLPWFAPATEAFAARWEAATTDQGGVSEAIVKRTLSGYSGPLAAIAKLPLLGHGIGLGTNAGARLATGEVAFLIAEGEFGRFLGEMGVILGLMYAGLRLGIIWVLFRTALRMARQGNPAPMVLLGFSGLPLLNGQWGQPTTLGFAILGGGLVLAAGKKPVGGASVPLPGSERNVELPQVGQRGRSVYAEMLHGRESDDRRDS